MWGKILCVIGGAAVGYLAREEIGVAVSEVRQAWDEQFGEPATSSYEDDIVMELADEASDVEEAGQAIA